MIFGSPPRDVSDALARLAQESAEQQQRRKTVRELIEAAELLAPGAARDAVFGEASRRSEGLAELTAADATVINFRRKRLLLAGFGLILAGALASLIVLGVKSASEPTDLAAGKPFTLSSTIGECHPEKSECGGVPTRILFHTQEQQSPWYQVDLGTAVDFSSVTVRNRTDMGEQRALPLVVEVSDDGTSFREVARKPDAFFTWRAEFPKQHARYVRLRVDRITWFHLEAVKVHP